jgi:hypothetical protein
MHTLPQGQMQFKLVQAVNKVATILLEAIKHLVAIIITEAIPFKDNSVISQVQKVLHANTA